MQTIYLAIPTSVFWTIFALLGLAFILMSWMLVHHWNYYGIKGNNKVFAKSLYFIGGGALLFFMLVFLVAYGIIL